ncbi:GNAT family N-acetyltransferase [Actinoplanes couchii]|uniref:N-acetyltransferase domain-containing protein n=1 Tax=Actinoplanes couchii TaxID=403638 RepID=A0ABQ3XL08_9ACTN|nr:GNAT family N-acetyltransferase [Actinoplanes couchii]MDR6319431.1 ribosomal protein S18 acetylase RimI-like enzyme [Actinoplanes couchii]GID59178.1 hypothetical protein Aco03nite_075820 [Actinoplanes couchii]
MTRQTEPADGVRIEASEPGRYLTEAAAIWAEATATRDGDPEIAPLDEARPVIERVLGGSARSLLIVAIKDDQVVGFAALAPLATDAATAEVHYVGVRPDHWSAGIGRRLMTALPGLARGFTRGELEVYLDNPRAVALYESLGWQPLGESRPHPRSGRREQRYQRDFA